MTPEPMGAGGWAFCPRCEFSTETGVPLRSFQAPGAMAAHLAADHGVSASVALSDARAMFPKAEPVARLDLAPRPAPAPPGTSGYLITTKESAMPRKNAPKPKYKRPEYTCGGCGATDHTARSTKCPAYGGPEAIRPPAQGEVRGRSAIGSVSDAIRAEITKKRDEIGKLEQALAVLGG